MYLWTLSRVSALCKQRGLVFHVEGQGIRAKAKWWRDVEPLTAALWGLPNENAINSTCLVLLQALKPAAYCGSTGEKEARSNGESFCGEKREKGFSFESILLLFCLGRRAERNECSVFMGPNTKHHVHTLMLAHTHTHTHTQTRAVGKPGSRISMRWRR